VATAMTMARPTTFALRSLLVLNAAVAARPDAQTPTLLELWVPRGIDVWHSLGRMEVMGLERVRRRVFLRGALRQGE
jgi:hypothetical protein